MHSSASVLSLDQWRDRFTECAYRRRWCLPSMSAAAVWSVRPRRRRGGLPTEPRQRHNQRRRAEAGLPLQPRSRSAHQDLVAGRRAGPSRKAEAQVASAQPGAAGMYGPPSRGFGVVVPPAVMVTSLNGRNGARAAPVPSARDPSEVDPASGMGHADRQWSDGPPLWRQREPGPKTAHAPFRCFDRGRRRGVLDRSLRERR